MLGHVAQHVGSSSKGCCWFRPRPAPPFAQFCPPTLPGNRWQPVHLLLAGLLPLGGGGLMLACCRRSGFLKAPSRLKWYACTAHAMPNGLGPSHSSMCNVRYLPQKMLAIDCVFLQLHNKSKACLFWCNFIFRVALRVLRLYFMLLCLCLHTLTILHNS